VRHLEEDSGSKEYLFYRRTLTRPIDPIFTLPAKYTPAWWRPTFREPIPPGETSKWKSMFWFFYFALLGRLHQFAVLQIRDSTCATVHSSTVFPKCFRFPFMHHGDRQIGALWTSPTFRNRGLATLVVQEILRAERQTNQAYWYVVASDNLPSVRVAEKNGFELHGIGYRRMHFGIRLLATFQEVKRS
jgi:RimJ/RimL family protein N-acetyltransferase